MAFFFRLMAFGRPWFAERQQQLRWAKPIRYFL